jgi:hypothetical protein
MMHGTLSSKCQTHGQGWLHTNLSLTPMATNKFPVGHELVHLAPRPLSPSLCGPWEKGSQVCAPSPWPEPSDLWGHL